MWHRVFPRFCGRFFFSDLTLRGGEHLPREGPVLWIGLHRNGAVDGFAYAAALSRPLVFMISTQLRRSPLARVFFNGIAVARSAAEGDREANRAALAECLELWHAGGELVVFPEGTSTLGPRHLPFKAGAAQLACDWLEQGGAPLRVVPLGVHYAAPWAFRSAAEIIVGPAVDLVLPVDLPALGRLREVKRRMSAALEGVGVNFPDETAQSEAEAIARLATWADAGSRFAILKACERGELTDARLAWRGLDAVADQTRAWRHHGVPLLPRDSGRREFATLFGLGPLVLAGLLCNAGPWAGAWWAARKFPDDRNVIALWKILAGLPLLALWVVAVVIATLAVGAVWAIPLYGALTFGAWAAYDAVKRSAVALANLPRQPRLRDPFWRVIAHCRSLENARAERPSAAA